MTNWAEKWGMAVSGLFGLFGLFGLLRLPGLSGLCEDLWSIFIIITIYQSSNNTSFPLYVNLK